MIRLGVLGSTKGTDLQAILDAIHNDGLDATVVVVVSNRENSYILERARNYTIPDVFVPHIGKTFAELSSDEKNKISHRGIALQKLRKILINVLK